MTLVQSAPIVITFDKALPNLQLLEECFPEFQFIFSRDPQELQILPLDDNSANFDLLVDLLKEFCNLRVAFSIDARQWVHDSFRSIQCSEEDIIVNSLAFGVRSNDTFRFTFLAKAVDCRECTEFPVTDKPTFEHIFSGLRRNCFRFDALHTEGKFVLRIPMKDADDGIRMGLRKVDAATRNRARRPYGLRREYNEIIINIGYDSISHIRFFILPDSQLSGMYTIMAYIDYRYPPSIFIGAIENGSRRKPERVVEWSTAFSFPDITESVRRNSCMTLSLMMTADKFLNMVHQIDSLINTSISFGKQGYNALRLNELYVQFTGLTPESSYLVDCIKSLGNHACLFLAQQAQDIQYGIQTRSPDWVSMFFKNMFLMLLSTNGISSIAEAHKFDVPSRIDSDYVKIAKAVITPTRVIYYPPEEMMGFPMVYEIPGIEKRLLRIVFKDDDYRTIHNFSLSNVIVEDTARWFFNHGIYVGGRRYHYMGYSNSQLREYGAYFLQTDEPREIIEIFKRVGEFKPEGVAKIMARFAQLFTQSRRMQSLVSPKHFVQIHDFEGHCPNDPTKIYCFSDGCGLMSLKFAQQLQKELRLDIVPSVVQFRFRGYKGILAVDPLLDKLNKFAVERSYVENPQIGCDLIFRDSQSKFSGTGESFHAVKHSGPSSVCLNKPLINVFCQVSLMQGNVCRLRIRNRILELVDQHIRKIQKTLIDLGSFRAALRDLPNYVVYDKLISYPTLIDEPFFRSMVKAKAKHQLMLLNDKKQIAIPPDLGRNCFGIVDCTGLLQYGQVFVCITEDVNDSRANAFTKVITGPIMVTKNPVCNAGDLRRFEAVDHPALRCYRDVIVFPANGPRPHPNEMAGSDLDGDEYSVIFDPELLLCQNEPAFDYTPEKEPPENVSIDSLLDKSKQFFVNYMVQDVIGSVSICHLGNSDLYGINSKVCLNISKKQVTAVDYAKTGIKTEDLTSEWNGVDPPERIHHAADFLGRDHVMSYKSNRLLGQIHRKTQSYYDAIKAIVDLPEDVVCDSFIVNDRRFKNPDARVSQDASDMYDSYCREIEKIMLFYGIQNEGELFSQCFLELRNPFGTREHDNSLFCTASNVQRAVIDIFAHYRSKFYLACGVPFPSDFDSKGIIHHVVEHIGFNAKQRAVECYRIAYQNDRKRFLSFPWIAWEALDAVRRDHPENLVLDPVNNIYLRHMNLSLRLNAEAVRNFEASLNEKFPKITPYMKRYPGLLKLIYILCRWRYNGYHFSVPRSTLITVILQFCLGNYPRPSGFVPCIELTKSNQTYEPVEWPNLGRIVLFFFETLSMREFRCLDYLYFGDLVFDGYPEASFDADRISTLHSAAINTYTAIAFNLRHYAWESPLPSTIQRGKPFVINVPLEYVACFEQCIDRLKAITECTNIAIRTQPVFLRRQSFKDKANNKRRFDNRRSITIWGEGTVAALGKLRSFFSVSVNCQGGIKNCQNISRFLETMQDNIIASLYKSSVSH